MTQAGHPPDEIGVIVQILEEFRRLDPDMPIQYALSFLTIARHPGLSMGDLAQRLGIAQSSASRNIAALSQWHSFNRAGHDLVVAHEDPRERRRKIVTLTPRGATLIETLRAIIAGHPMPPPPGGYRRNRADAARRGQA
jgi:DNA-binding MarR family transcriptional regulator